MVWLPLTNQIPTMHGLIQAARVTMIVNAVIAIAVTEMSYSVFYIIHTYKIILTQAFKLKSLLLL
jgi:hypothetical protein